MSLVPLFEILLAFVGPIAGLLILYWIIRLAVRHGIEDARTRRGRETTPAGYWDPARS
jgi:protein-S-isoprenylcysteine O-methyltransferase Ste14